MLAPYVQEEIVTTTKTVTVVKQTLDRVTNSFEFLNLLKLNLQGFGIWANSVGFVVTFSVLAIFYYYRPSWVSDH
jgi:E3 ubiquitin-protein ligase DOA10